MYKKFSEQNIVQKSSNKINEKSILDNNLILSTVPIKNIIEESTSKQYVKGYIPTVKKN